MYLDDKKCRQRYKFLHLETLVILNDLDYSIFINDSHQKKPIIG